MAKRDRSLFLLIAFALLIPISNSGFGQSTDSKSAEPFNLTGTWVRDSSSFEDALSESTKKADSKTQVKLEIFHLGAELRVVRTTKRPEGPPTTRLSVYFTDGRGETYRLNDTTTIKSKTSWKKGRILSKGSAYALEDVNWDFTEEWILSSDGKVLTVKNVRSSDLYRNGRPLMTSTFSPKFTQIFKRE